MGISLDDAWRLWFICATYGLRGFSNADRYVWLQYTAQIQFTGMT